MQLNGNLSSDIIGTNPVYPPIVDHSWLDVDLSKYDNYPSDNNPVRVVPKLNQLWNHAATQTGVNLVPNAQVMPLGVRSSEEDARQVDQIVKEAKKAVMAGLTGKKLSEYIRSRFSSRHLGMAQEPLKKVAEEIGLLGNVYIDASAFNSYNEAEQFLSQNRTRLARDILLNVEEVNPSHIAALASTFHKNVVSSITYDEDTLRKYRDHLVQAKRIPEDMVIASKEDLRKAFLYVAPVQETVTAAKAEKRMDPKEMQVELEKNVEASKVLAAEERDSILMSKISPIVSFVQENLARGKTANDLKGMVKNKFAMVDLKDASEALGVVLSKEGLSEEHINGLVKQGNISMALGKELKKIGKKFPIKKSPKFADAVSVEPSVGVPGYLYSLEGKRVVDKNEGYRQASMEALKKGFDIEAVKAKLLKKLSADDTDQVLLDAVTMLNAFPAGAVANRAQKAAKVLVEEPAPKQTLPDPSTIASQTQEILGTFEGCVMDVDIDPARDFNNIEVNELFNRTGIDDTI